jgi:hypothetical protein
MAARFAALAQPHDQRLTGAHAAGEEPEQQQRGRHREREGGRHERDGGERDDHPGERQDRATRHAESALHDRREIYTSCGAVPRIGFVTRRTFGSAAGWALTWGTTSA